MQNFLTARWEQLIMANYAVDPAILQPYLPAGTQPDIFEGKCYVSLVGFLFVKTKLFGVPIPFMGTFEEVNLRFYVKREEAGEWRRGVVFINETVPFRAVAWLANKLYKEHYTAIPTRHRWSVGEERDIKYEWKIKNEWNSLQVRAGLAEKPMLAGGIEEFIFEHYYGYTRVSDHLTEEYKVEHPRWNTHPIIDYKINCDFAGMYGPAFGHLADKDPDSIMLAKGSAISVKWKRRKIHV